MHIPSFLSAYTRDFGETKLMPFLIKNDELLQKYNEIWEKVDSSIKKDFNSEPVYNKNYLKTKIKSQKKALNILVYRQS